jgi:Zn-dependent metalloprotease
MVSRMDKTSQTHAGFLFKGINVDAKPKLAREKAEALIREKFGTEVKVEGKLGVLPVKSGSRLAYRFNVFKNLKEYYTVYLDANTGDILRAFNQVDYFNAGKMFTKEGRFFMPSAGFNKAAEDKSAQIKPAAGSGEELNNTRVKIPVSEVQKGIYVLFDPGKNILTLDAMGEFRIDAAGTMTPDDENDDAQLVVTENKEEWNNKAAISAHHHAELIYDFLEERLQRKSLDGNGLPIRSIVNAVLIVNGEKGVDNAFYT